MQAVFSIIGLSINHFGVVLRVKHLSEAWCCPSVILKNSLAVFVEIELSVLARKGAILVVAVHELALERHAIGPSKSSLTRLLVFVPVPIIGAATTGRISFGPRVLSFTVFFAVLKLAFVFAAVLVYDLTLSLLHSVDPVAIIDAPTGPSLLSFALALVAVEISLVLYSAVPGHRSVAVPLVALPGSLVHTAVLVDHLTLALLHVFLPTAFVPSA